MAALTVCGGRGTAPPPSPLPPSGRLREPLASMVRAHAAILTGAPAADHRGAAFAEALRPYGFTGPGFASRTVPGAARRLDGGELEPGASVFLVTAIARPEAFAGTVRELGFEIAGQIRFPDHHRYPPASLAR